MKEELITFETAKLAKEKRFTLQTNPFGYITKFYRPSTKTLLSYGRTGRSKLNTLIYAPTQSLLQRWLREVHDIIVTPCTFNKGFLEKDKFCYQYYIENKTDLDDDRLIGMLEYKTYEEALEKGLIEGLKLIKNV